MSEVFEHEELVGDADEDVVEKFNSSEEDITKTSGYFGKNKNNTPSRSPVAKAKSVNTNKPSAILPVGDDLLQAFSLDSLCTPSKKVAKLEPSIRLESGKSATATKNSKTKEVTSSKGIRVGKNALESKTDLSISDHERQSFKSEIISQEVKNLEGNCQSLKTEKRSEESHTYVEQSEIKKNESNAILQEESHEIQKTGIKKREISPSTSSSLKQTLEHDSESLPIKSNLLKTTSSTTPATDQVNINKEESKAAQFTEEDLRNIDLCLVEKMVENLNKQILPPYHPSDSRHKVKISPLEIADLAEMSVQNLIQEYPMMSIVFKRQIGKFKKKKGYAEFHFTKVLEVKELVKKLIPLKLMEKNIEVTITAWYSGNSQELSFHLNHEENHDLMTLIKSGQDPHAKSMGSDSGKLHYELVPSTVTVPLLQSIFPFCTYVRITRGTTSNMAGKTMIGPIFIHYNNQKWRDAVMKCFSDFVIDGYSLVLKNEDRKQSFLKSVTSAIEENDAFFSDSNEFEIGLKKSPEANEKEQSIKDGHREKNTANLSSAKPKDDKRGVSDEDNEDDDAISNMTRDVCAGMLESLDQLKALDESNPNLDRIMKMRDQLDKLQKSLGPEKKATKVTESHETEKQSKHHSNVWEIIEDDINSTKHSGADVVGGRFQSRNSRQPACDERLTEPRRQLKEKAGPDRGRDARQSRSFSNVSPRKNTGALGHKGNQYAKKFNDRRRREEEEQQKREEEAKKEVERKNLIKKIEEARLRDMQRAEERAQSSSMWISNASGERSKESHNFSSSSREHGFERGTNRPMKRQLEESQDDGVDQRLAAFEQELAEKGVIQTHKSSPKRAKTMTADRFNESDGLAGIPIYMEDEYQSIISEGKCHALPHNYRVRIISSPNRQCPVKSCPNTKYFRDINSFLDHWSTFHVPEATMRFCQKCVAYFTTAQELGMHLEKLHWISQSEAKFMVQQARVKVVSNPSFRDPHPFLPPLL